MDDVYERCRKVWDGIFAKENKIQVPKDKGTGNPDLDAGLDWLCEGSKVILDFGCGNGSMLFYCALRGSERHLGIDISSEGIMLAKRRKELMPGAEFDFRTGDVSSLATIETASIDAVILANIIDNLFPADAEKLLEHVRRILRPGGKVLVKLNPYLEQEQILEWNIKVLQDNLLDDGLLLWNQTTEEWTEMFSRHLAITEYRDIYFEQYHQYNRMFLLIKG